MLEALMQFMVMSMKEAMDSVIRSLSGEKNTYQPADLHRMRHSFIIVIADWHSC